MHLVTGVSHFCPILVDVTSPTWGAPHAQIDRVLLPATELEEDLKCPPTADRQAGGTGIWRTTMLFYLHCEERKRIINSQLLSRPRIVSR